LTVSAFWSYLFSMSHMAIATILSESDHAAPTGHPENARRLEPIAREFEKRLASGQLVPLTITQHGLDPILRIHTKQHVDSIRTSRHGYLDGDTYVTPTSFAAACNVVDACLSGVDGIMTEQTKQVFILGRPPGHHAPADRAMGFCLFNNVAIAAQYAIDQYDLKRVAIIDFDVHHGNGTQAIFYDRTDVFFCSTHRVPFYPGTGYPNETGEGKGTGFTLNCPLMVGDGDKEILSAVTDSFLPALTMFHPELVVVSAGFDAHLSDPLGGLSVSSDGFRRIGSLLRDFANKHCSGRILAILEGGYDPQGNLNAITSYIEGLQ
jgi:acetoin utilization deacetylase AcuC-like enzyme